MGTSRFTQYLKTSAIGLQTESVRTEKSQLAGKRLMPEMRFTEFPAISVQPRAGISRPAPETDV